MNLLKIRLFGSSSCENCKIIKQSLKYYDISYDFIDVDDTKNEKLCDLLNIEEIPVIQIINSSNNSVIRSHTGLIDPMKFIRSTSNYVQKRLDDNRKNNANKKGCKNCYD